MRIAHSPSVANNTSTSTNHNQSKIMLNQLNLAARESTWRCQAICVALAVQFAIFVLCLITQAIAADWQNLLFSSLVGVSAGCLAYALASSRA